MVDTINPVLATVASATVRVDSSVSIGSEPDNARVAARQAQMTADLLAHLHAGAPERDIAEENPDLPHPEQLVHRHPAPEPDAPEEDARLSGESERIGTVNFDEDTPFGDRTAIL